MRADGSVIHDGEWHGGKPMMTVESTTEKTARAPSSAGTNAIVVYGGEYTDPTRLSLSHAELTQGTPDGVDPAKKEAYLADGEFEAVMGTPRAAFLEMAAWKQAALKKVGLF